MRSKVSIWNEKRLGSRIVRASIVVVASIALPVLITGCCDECANPIVPDPPPGAPSGFVSITGDGFVELQWSRNTDHDLAGYDLFWSDNADGPYDYMVSVGRHKTFYIDTDVTNGVTYFYKIRAYDGAGNVSPFGTSVYGTDYVFDTPRPAGEGLTLYEFTGQNTGLSGYDFSEFRVQAWNVSTTDVYFGSPNGIATLFGKGNSIGAGVDVQDYGFVDLDFVDWAPDIFDGWSPSKQVELIPGHSYVVQVEDGQFYQYAKVYVVSVTNELVVLDWAYQEAEGNPELAPGAGGAR